MKYVISTVFWIISLTCYPSIAADWRSTTTKNTPIRGGEYSMVLIKGDIYLVGGRDGMPVSRLDSKNLQWQTKAKPPIDLHHFQAQVYKGEVYVIGSFTGDYPKDTPVSLFI